MSRELIYIALLAFSQIFLGLHFMTSQGCSKHHPHEPPDTVLPDTVHVHHDHEVVIIDTVFQNVICDSVDLTVEFIVIGDQSAPNEYAYFLNEVEVGRFIVTDTFSEPTEITFYVVFEGVTFGDVITIRKISGSRADAIGSSIIDIKCSSQFGLNSFDGAYCIEDDWPEFELGE